MSLGLSSGPAQSGPKVLLEKSEEATRPKRWPRTPRASFDTRGLQVNFFCVWWLMARPGVGLWRNPWHTTRNLLIYMGMHWLIYPERVM